jgi:hypothetical protein
MALPTLYFENRLADAAIAASSTAAGYAAANVADWRPYTWWKPAALPATLTVDCAAPAAADYALVYGHDLFTHGCTLEVRGSTDNFASSNVLVASHTPAVDEPFVVLFNSVSYRYWRLRITGSAAPVLAIAAIGARMVCPIGVPQGFDPLGRDVDGQINTNENGQPLGRIVTYERWTSRIRLQRVLRTWARDTFLPAWRAHLRGTPFVFTWDLDADPSNVRLVTSGKKIDVPHYSGARCDLEFELSGVIT